MSTKPAKSDEYRRLAAEATVLAGASSLDHVREKHEMAALQWSTLAATEDSRSDRWARPVSSAPSPAMWTAP